MNRTLIAAALFALAAAPAAAQAPAERQNQLTIDLHVVGGSLYYARQRGPGTYLGGGFGVGGDFLGVMLVGGRHFGEACCVTYEPRDAAGNEQIYEVVHLDVFRRAAPSQRFEWEAGLRGSLFFHGDDSDDDLGGGFFGGGRGAAFYGWRNVKIGSQLLAGVFSEGAGTTEFGVLLQPLTVRVTLGW